MVNDHGDAARIILPLTMHCKAKIFFFLSKHLPVNTKHLYSMCAMLDQRRICWADVVLMLCKCFVFIGFILLFGFAWHSYVPDIRNARSMFLQNNVEQTSYNVRNSMSVGFFPV